MGGSIGFTAIKDKRVYKMCRWTNPMPGFFKSIQVLQPEIDPKETERHFQEYLRSWLEMKEDWEKNGPEGPFKHAMTDSYFGSEEAGMAPDGYGLVVMDYDRKKLYSMQGYCSFDHMNTVFSVQYYDYIEGNFRRISEYDKEQLETQLKPLMDMGFVDTLRFHVNFGEDFKLLGKDESGYFDKRNVYNVSGLDLRFGDSFEQRYGSTWDKIVAKFKPGSRLQNMPIMKRNRDKIPEFIWEAMSFVEKQRDLKHDTEDQRSPFYIWFDIIPKTDWEVFNYSEDYEGAVEMLTELKKHYKFTEKELLDWQDWILQAREEYDGELEIDESEITTQ